MGLFDFFRRAIARRLPTHDDLAAIGRVARDPLQKRAKEKKQLAASLVENGVYDNLDLSETDITALPDGIKVRFRLNLRDCKQLTKLPARLSVGSLNIAGCTAIEKLPECSVENPHPENHHVMGDRPESDFLVLGSCLS